MSKSVSDGDASHCPELYGEVISFTENTAAHILGCACSKSSVESKGAAEIQISVSYQV